MMEIGLGTSALYPVSPRDYLTVNDDIFLPHLIHGYADSTAWRAEDGCQMTDEYQVREGTGGSSPISRGSTPPAALESIAPMLPPCRVCGEKASGFHYGANTCEACKGFFRRSLQRKENYRCTGGGGGGTSPSDRGTSSCDILPGKRSICAACRYQKCLHVGMSKQAIKTGRYTHEKKTKDIQEVKRLQHQQKLQNEGKTETLPETNESVIERIIQQITEVHMMQTPHTAEFFEQLPRKEKEFLEQRSLQQAVFGTMRPLPHHEYLRIYQTTGMDVDGRRAMITHMIPCIEKAVKRFISFAKSLPGFKDLMIDDQIALIKGSRFEAWLMSAYRSFNSEHNIFTHVCGYTLHIDEMARLYDYVFLEKVFSIASKLRRYDLSMEEECVLKGLVIFSRDRCQLQEPNVVERCQMTMMDTLEYLRAKNRPNDRLFTARLISVLVEMRSLTELHQTQEGKIGTEWCTDIKIPPLLYEIFSV